jgi:hypothetical protein
LAEPPLPQNPSQADYGAQDYWLHCMPCHGDYGQGLTVEFRVLYPEAERNCWESGCHGKNPYESGFTIPERVPKIIGPGALSNYETAQHLFTFIRAAMPFQAPGSLEDETYWNIVSFLVREIRVTASFTLLGPENANIVFLLDIWVAEETSLPLENGQNATSERSIIIMPSYVSVSEFFAFLLVMGIIFLFVIFIQTAKSENLNQ